MIIVPVEKTINWRKPPIALIVLVILNVIVFAFYQANDNEILDDAVEYYDRNNMLSLEWRPYKAYLEQSGSTFSPDKNEKHLLYYIVSDAGFDRYMMREGSSLIPSSKREVWRQKRVGLDEITLLSSTKKYAFYADNPTLFQTISSQFLHADFMHLLGNMIFLILAGFAVEAAIGSFAFLVFYLLSGTAGALLYAAFTSASGSLIGASGAISGVMAMYVVLFGMRKIKFFYWVLVFTGYIRTTAIVMLPFYLLKEVHGYLTLEGSNVAFSAHIGGFLAGAVLVLLTKSYKSDAIDDDYLDTSPKAVDQNALALQRVYDAMGNCEFNAAWTLLKGVKENDSENPDIIDLEYNLIRARQPSRIKEYLIHRMDKLGNSKGILSAQLKLWSNMQEQQQLALSITKRNMLLEGALMMNEVEMAETVFTSLKASDCDNMTLSVLAKKISVSCQKSNKAPKSEKYRDLAAHLSSFNFSDDAENML